MATVRYSEDHVWVREEVDGTLSVGISKYAQEKLGDVVYVELPQVEQEVVVGDEIAIVESVKTAAEVKSPVSGTVTAINEKLAEEPQLVNTDPLGDGWFFTLAADENTDLAELMDEFTYQDFVAGL